LTNKTKENKTSRQHYSRERTQAGHKSYEDNNTGKQQQNMTLEFSTYDFREKVGSCRFVFSLADFVSLV
jgi:hypothetical protein